MQSVFAKLAGLDIHASWYLRTDASKMRRIIYLNLSKGPVSRKHEKGILTLLQLAEPQSAGVGILNVQASTLVVRSRLDHDERNFLEARSAKFIEISESLE